MLRNTGALKREENIIHLTYEDIIMLKKEITYRNPLMNLGYDNEDILPDGGFGAVMAHAGVGKTALLVQMALNTMLREKNVLHISLHDAVSKVDVWYHELFQNIAQAFNAAEIKDYWEKNFVFPPCPPPPTPGGKTIAHFFFYVGPFFSNLFLTGGQKRIKYI